MGPEAQPPKTRSVKVPEAIAVNLFMRPVLCAKRFDRFTQRRLDKKLPSTAFSLDDFLGRYDRHSILHVLPPRHWVHQVKLTVTHSSYAARIYPSRPCTAQSIGTIVDMPPSIVGLVV